MGIKLVCEAQEPSTTDAQVVLALSECRNFPTVNPPFENARSTSVDVAKVFVNTQE